MKTNDKDRFVRWQSNLRTQVSFTNNLLLTISIGLCAYIFDSLINSNELKNIVLEKPLFKSAFQFLFISISFGIATNFSRIVDFRLTLDKIRKEIHAQDFEISKSMSKTFGKITWTLFYFQIATFIGACIFCAKIVFFTLKEF